MPATNREGEKKHMPLVSYPDKKKGGKKED